MFYESMLICLSGLVRLRDKLQSELRDLLKARPRGNVDQNLMSEIARLESSLTIARDDLVGFY
jgi:structural maintenance of chromosome 1